MASLILNTLDKLPPYLVNNSPVALVIPPNFDLVSTICFDIFNSFSLEENTKTFDLLEMHKEKKYLRYFIYYKKENK